MVSKTLWPDLLDLTLLNSSIVIKDFDCDNSSICIVMLESKAQNEFRLYILAVLFGQGNWENPPNQNIKFLEKTINRLTKLIYTHIYKLTTYLMNGKK
jgi:hypothetical protein